MRHILYIFLIMTSFVMVKSFELEKDQYIRIPLYRQKSVRENIINSKNLDKLGIDISSIHRHHKHNSTNGTDAFALFRFLDMEFYGKALIGKTGQTVNLMFDTAWQTTWVMSKDCDWKEIGCWFHNKYDHTVSSTYFPDGRKYIISEGSYNLSGYYSIDTISLGHSRVDNQSFVEITNVPTSFILSRMDGIMGLGIKTNTYEPFFYNLLGNHSIKNPVFSVYLNRDKSSSKGGDIYLGFINKKHIHRKLLPNNKTIPEPITYLNVDGSEGLWKFRVDRISLNLSAKNKTIPFCTSGCNGIADTANTNIIGPSADIVQINTLIGAQSLLFGRYRVNCGTINILPKITFVLGGKDFLLSGPDYIQKMSWGPLTLCISSFVPSSSNYWVLGGAFLAKYYSIYDIQNSQIGLVRAASA